MIDIENLQCVIDIFYYREHVEEMSQECFLFMTKYDLSGTLTVHSKVDAGEDIYIPDSKACMN